MWVRFLSFAALALLLSAGTRPVQADVMEYAYGHADVGVAYEDGDFFLHYHIGGDSNVAEGEYDPSELYVRVSDSLYFPSVPLPLYGFTGATEEDPDAWGLPQSNTSGVPFMGFATEELDMDDWDGAITFELLGFTFQPQGSGVTERAHFSLWQQVLATPVPYMATSDGIDSSDSLTMNPGGHDHYNWGFTEEGVYQIDFRVYGTHVTDGYLEDSGTLTFAVGNNTAVPEPGAWMILPGLAVLGLVMHYGRRRSRTSTPVTE